MISLPKIILVFIPSYCLVLDRLIYVGGIINDLSWYNNIPKYNYALYSCYQDIIFKYRYHNISWKLHIKSAFNNFLCISMLMNFIGFDLIIRLLQMNMVSIEISMFISRMQLKAKAIQEVLFTWCFLFPFHN